MHKSASLIFLSWLALSACGSGSGSGSNSTANNEQLNSGASIIDVASWAFIDLHDNSGAYASALGVFNRNTGPGGDLYRDSILGPSPELDTCIVEENVADPNDTLEYINISAGSELVVNAENGVFTVIEKSQFEEFIFYSTQATNETTPVPEGLVASFPGDEFPAMSGLNMPNVETLTDVSHCDKSDLAPSTTFTWQAASNANTMIIISANAQNPAGGTDRLVNCFVADDGQFNLPGTALAKLEATDLLGIYAFQRSVRTVVEGDAAAIALRRFSNACHD